MYSYLIKRIIDFFTSLIGLIVLSPLFLLLWFWLSITNNGAGAFFFQERLGKDEKIFKLIKFKTMSDERDPLGILLPDAERLTRLGRFIRSTSLDEIPQLINVIKGEMSLIGPRPLKVHNLLLYTKEQARRHEVRPGITGWAQVNGRNFLKLSKKFEYDVWYVDHISFKLDMRIFFMTLYNVLLSKDIGEGNSTMEEVDDLNFMDRLKEIESKKTKG